VAAINTQIEARQKLEAYERDAPATPPNGAHEPRAFAVWRDRSETRADFPGDTWRTPDGARVPVLAPEHRMATFAPAGDTPAEEIGLSGVLRAAAFGPRTEIENRAMKQLSVGAGGAIVPAPLAAELIDRLRAQSVAIRAGARTVPMTASTLRIARQVNDPAFGWRPEGAAIPESDPSFDQVILTAKTCAVFFKVSNELLEDGQNTDAACRNLLASAAAVALDQAVLVGAGGDQPLGIRGQTGIQNVSMGTNGAALTGWAPMLNAVQALEAANAGNVTAMVAAPRTARTIYGFADTTGQPLQPPPRVAGVPLLVTTSMPINETQGTATAASSIIMGDFREALIGLRTDITIRVLDQRFADTGEVAFLAWMRADVALARPAALSRIAGIIP
jgi:HK97 family phage major capsid protein